MTDRQAALAEAYRRGIMQPEQKAAYEEAMRRGLVTEPLDRSMGRRLLDNLSEGFNRSGAGQVQREYDNDRDGLDLGDVLQAPRLREGGLIDRGLDAVLGSDRGYLRGSTALTPADQQERDRRASYAARAEADPVRNAGDFAASAVGLIAGGGVSPENWVGPASIAKGSAGRYLAGQITGRALVGAGAAAGTDVLLQGSDVMAGIQDAYEPIQTVGAGLLGGGLSVAVDGVRPIADVVRRAYTDRITPRAPEPVAVAPVGGVDAPVELTAALPEFGIVKAVERQRPILDAMKRAREGEFGQMVGTALGRAYTAVVSDTHPLAIATESLRRETEALTGNPLDIAPSMDPRKLSRGRFDWAAIGHQDLLHGVHDYRGTAPTTPAMADVMTAIGVRAQRAGEKPEVALQRFNEYMVARRASAEWDRVARGELEKPPVARTKEEADAFIKHIDSAEPEYRELSDAVNAYSGGLLKKALDGGLIDKATYDASLAGRDFYVPLRRVMDEEPARGGKGGGKNAGPEVKRFKGSDRDVVDPVSVIIERTYRLNQRLRQNDLNLSLVRLGERLDGLLPEGETNRWIRKVPEPKRPVRVSKAELKAQARDKDRIDDLFDDEGVEAWRAGEVNDAGRPIIYAWRNGKREAWEVIDETWGKDVFEAVAGMPKGMEDTFLNMMAAPTAVLAQTITRDPAFLFSNFIRDQVSSWIVSDVGFVPGEGLLGIADELRQADVTRLYGVGGGISGGAATAMLGDALHRADSLALAKRGVKAKYFSSLGGLLATSEISETGTRLRVFQRAFERAKKAGFGEYDALIEATHTARDLIDFGRAGSKMHMTRRLVTFLNAYTQGLDKTLRTLSADGAAGRVPLKDALRPLFQQAPAGAMRAEDVAALKLAGTAWMKVAAIATFGLAITAMFHDDPDYQQANERVRATHWVIPWGENLVRIPKPFELAFLSNIVERGFEATVGKDERAWGRMWRGLGMLFMPPDDIPVLSVIGGLASNENTMTGRPIVPEHLQNLPPELQYQHWNSQFSRWLGEQVGVSPAKIDYAIQGFAGPYGSYMLGAMDASNPDRPSGSWTDLPVVRRFVSPSYRGSQDKRDFYDRVGAKNSELRRALNGIKEYQELGRPEAASAIFDDLDEAGKIFVASQQGETPTRRLNPLIRAEVFGREASRVIGELNGAQPKDEGRLLPAMSRRQRQAVEDAIERVTVAELRNAMIATRQHGFQNREMIDRDGLWEDLRDISPEVAEELDRRLRSGRDRAYSYEAVMRLWPDAESRLKSDGSTARLDDLARRAQRDTPGWGRKERKDDEAEGLTFTP